MKPLLIVLSLLCVPCFAEPMDEVNAQRRNFGLPPLVRDAELMQFAQDKALWQAAHGICLDNGYNGHEGVITPSGCVEGTGCLDPDWGWGTCAMRTYGTHPAGAGIAIGADGKRYMCLVIRTEERGEWEGRRSLIDTSHMTPHPPSIRRCMEAPPPKQPIGVAFEQHAFYRDLTEKYYSRRGGL